MTEDPLAELKRRILRRPVILYMTVTFLVLTAILAALNQAFNLRTRLVDVRTGPPADVARPTSTTAAVGTTTGDAVYLSALPSRISHASEVLFAPQSVGKTNVERGITASDRYERSIAVTVADRVCLARVTLDYDVPAGARSFHTDVGFEEASSPNGEARFEVFLDNVSAYDRTFRPFATDTISLPLVNVTRVRLAVFVTLCNGARGRAVWGDPQFRTR